MKRRLDEVTVKKIYTTLLERFGEPIGKTIPDREAIADERGGGPHKGKKQDNRGFGSASLYEDDKLAEAGVSFTGWQEPADVNKTWTDENTGEVRGYCPLCKGRGKIDSVRQHKTVKMTCTYCKGAKIVTKQPRTTEGLEGGRHYGHAASCTCADCSRTYEETHPPVDAPEPGMDEATVTLKEPGGQTGTTMTSSTAAPPEECEKCGGNRVAMIPGDMAKCKDCGRVWMPLDEMDECGLDEEDLTQKAPPGRERQVKALKKNPDIDNPFAVAWASYNKKH